MLQLELSAESAALAAYGAIRHHTARNGIIRHGTIRHHTAPQGIMRHHTAPEHHRARYATVRQHSITPSPPTHTHTVYSLWIKEIARVQVSTNFTLTHTHWNWCCSAKNTPGTAGHRTTFLITSRKTISRAVSVSQHITSFTAIATPIWERSRRNIRKG